MKRINEPTTKPPDRVVLYVEDEETNWEVTELRLRDRYKMLWARSAEEACTIVRQRDGQFHVVLMDIQLKGSTLDGLELTRLLRGTMPPAEIPSFGRGLPTVACPVFFVTAFGNLHSQEKMDEVGGDAYMPKPVDFLKLSNMLASAHARRAIAALKGL